MKAKRSVFDSKIEENINKHLSALWGEKVLILSHVPVNDVVNIYDKNAEITYDEKEKFLVKTNFDFVVASKKDGEYGRPLLVIEFDGLGCGFSYNGVYCQCQDIASDEYRKLKLDCKIRICEQADIPLIVLSWDEVENILDDEQLYIIDGIIGEVLWHDEFNRLLNEGNDEFEGRLEDINDPEMKKDVINSYCTGCEVRAASNVNAIVKKCVSLSYRAITENLVGKHGLSPIEEGNLIGYKYFAYLNDNVQTYLESRVLVRRVNCSKADSMHVALDLAELLLWKKVFYVTGNDME